MYSGASCKLRFLTCIFPNCLIEMHTCRSRYLQIPSCKHLCPFVYHICDSHGHQKKYLYRTPPARTGIFTITGQTSDTPPDRFLLISSLSELDLVGFWLNKCARDEPALPSPGFRKQHYMQFVCLNNLIPLIVMFPNAGF